MYDPTRFAVASQEDAMALILTQEGELTTAARWATETPYLVGLVPPGDTILDYGCGIGRMARALLEARPTARVIGIDTSPSMRDHALRYVRSARFSVCGPEHTPSLLPIVDVAIAIWTLQHCPTPEADLDLIRATMKPDARMLVVNSNRRLIPVQGGWADDGQSIYDLMYLRGFIPDQVHGTLNKLNPAQVGEVIAEDSWWGIYRRQSC